MEKTKIELIPKEKNNIVLLTDCLFNYPQDKNGFYKGFKDDALLSDIVELCQKHKIKWTYLNYYLKE